MTKTAGANDILVEDIDPELLRKIEESAKVSGRSVEKEAIFLLERGLVLSESRSA